MPVGTIVRKCHIWTELFHARSATGALMVGCNHASDTDDVTSPKSRHTSPYFRSSADDLMARNARVSCRHQAVPFVASSVKVRVADTAEQDLDMNIALGHVPTQDSGSGECGGWTCGSKCLGFGHFNQSFIRGKMVTDFMEESDD